MRKSIVAVLVMSAVSFSAAATNTDYVGTGNYNTDKAAQSSRDAGQDAAIHEVHMNMLTKYSESWGLEDRANISKLQETKLDKSVFTADQERQDKALDTVVTKQAATDAKQTSDLKTYADKKATSAYTTSVAHTDAKVARADADRKAGDDSLNVRIEQEQSNRATQDRVITDRVRKEEVNRAAADNSLSERINTKVDNSVFNQRSTVVDQRFSDTQQRIDNNKAEQAKVNKAVANTLDNHEGRIQSLEQQNASKFASIDKRVDDVEKTAKAGAASAMAQANIPQVMAEGEFGIGAGAGTYAGESALAVGASFAPRENLVFKATVSTDSQHNFGAGAGVMVSFR